jgi:hypothetical protein
MAIARTISPSWYWTALIVAQPIDRKDMLPTVKKYQQVSCYATGIR